MLHISISVGNECEEEQKKRNNIVFKVLVSVLVRAKMRLFQSWEKSHFSNVKSSVNSLSSESQFILNSFWCQKLKYQVKSQVYCWYFFEVEVKCQFIYTEVYVKSIADGTPKDNL